MVWLQHFFTRQQQNKSVATHPPSVACCHFLTAPISQATFFFQKLLLLYFIQETSTTYGKSFGPFNFYPSNCWRRRGSKAFLLLLLSTATKSPAKLTSSSFVWHNRPVCRHSEMGDCALRALVHVGSPSLCGSVPFVLRPSLAGPSSC